MQNLMTMHAAPADKLAMLRSEIDRIDDRLLDLIERRLDCARQVAALKAAEERPALKMRPRREQAIVDRMVGRARRAPAELVQQVWRTIISHSLQAQVRTEILLCTNGDRAELLDRVRDRFGPAAPCRWAASAAEAVEAARLGETVAVIAPELLGEAEAEGLTRFERLRSGDGAVIGVAIGRLAEDEAEAASECGRTER